MNNDLEELREEVERLNKELEDDRVDYLQQIADLQSEIKFQETLNANLECTLEAVKWERDDYLDQLSDLEVERSDLSCELYAAREEIAKLLALIQEIEDLTRRQLDIAVAVDNLFRA